MGNAKKQGSKETAKKGVQPGQEGQGDSKQKELPKVKVMWITALMSNGDRFKIPAKVIARRMELMKKGKYEDLMRDSKALIAFAEKNMAWADLSQSAHQYTLDTFVDYAEEWSGSEKGVILEPAPIKEKAPNPNVKPDFVTVKDLEESGEDDEDDEDWGDDDD
jgi:hypothetical protein